MGIRSFLYRLASILGDLSVVKNPTPQRIARRIKNKAVGKALNKFKIWR